MAFYPNLLGIGDPVQILAMPSYGTVSPFASGHTSTGMVPVEVVKKPETEVVMVPEEVASDPRRAVRPLLPTTDIFDDDGEGGTPPIVEYNPSWGDMQPGTPGPGNLFSTTPMNIAPPGTLTAGGTPSLASPVGTMLSRGESVLTNPINAAQTLGTGGGLLLGLPGSILGAGLGAYAGSHAVDDMVQGSTGYNPDVSGWSQFFNALTFGLLGQSGSEQMQEEFDAFSGQDNMFGLDDSILGDPTLDEFLTKQDSTPSEALQQAIDNINIDEIATLPGDDYDPSPSVNVDDFGDQDWGGDTGHGSGGHHW